MLEILFGSKNRVRVLEYIHIHRSAYGKEIATHYQCSIDPIQKQLARLEQGGILHSKKDGKKRIYQFSIGHTLYRPLSLLLENAIQEKKGIIKHKKKRRRY
jgi:predicted transcriptional regulator